MPSASFPFNLFSFKGPKPKRLEKNIRNLNFSDSYYTHNILCVITKYKSTYCGKTVDNVLKRLRKERRYTLLELSKRSGVHWRTLQVWERGGLGRAKLCNLKKVADALECSIDELIDGEDL